MYFIYGTKTEQKININMILNLCRGKLGNQGKCLHWKVPWKAVKKNKQQLFEKLFCEKPKVFLF